MNKFIFILILIFGIKTSAQTVLISPTVGNGGFESGSDGWTVVNGSQVNKWVFDTGALPGFSGSKSAYISKSPTAPYVHAFDPGPMSISFFYKDITFPAGETDINLSFKILADTFNDYLGIYLLPTTYNPVAGFPPQPPANWVCNLMGSSYTTKNISITPDVAGNINGPSTKRLIFMWRNWGGTTSSPRPSVLDDITLITKTPTIPPPCTTILEPTSGANYVSPYTTIKWNPVINGGITGYKISIGTAPGGTDVMNAVNVGNVTSYNITSQQLLYNTTYYLKVMPVNSAGTADCQEIVFTTGNFTNCPTNIAMAGASNIDLTPTMTWYNAVGATGHRLTVGTTHGGTDILDHVEVPVSGTSNNTSYIFPSSLLNYNTTYYFFLEPYQGNHASISCNVYTFTTRPAPPSNDNITDAIDLTVNPNMDCAIKTTGNGIGAYPSQQLPSLPTLCNPQASDVWYRFVATNSRHSIKISPSLNYQVLHQSPAGSPTYFSYCNNIPNFISGLIPGETYYIRLLANTYDFEICLGTPPAVPENDNCSTAKQANSFPYTFTQNDGSGATNSLNNLACPISANGVWYQFTGDGSNIKIEVNSTSNWDPIINVNKGSCYPMSCVGTQNQTGPGVGAKETFIFKSEPGAIYSVNIANAQNFPASGNFTINISNNELVLSTNEVSGNKKDIILYPNPFEDVLNINSIINLRSATITDVSGKLVKTINNPGSALHLKELKSGVYFVTLETHDGAKQIIKTIKK